MWERSSGRLVAVVTAALILSMAAVPGFGAAASTGASSQSQLATGPIQQQSVDTDSVRLIVSVAENGSATWTVQYWTRLDDENTTDAFESLQQEIRASPSNYSDRFASRMRTTVATAENATGREMSATGFEVSAETRTPPQYGVITYRFRWNGFAAVDGDTIRIGDAIEGLFLDDRTRLVVEWPAGYAPTAVTPDPGERRSNAVVWRGAETSFVSGEPTVRLAPEPAGTTGGGGEGTAAPTGNDSPFPLLGVGLLFAVIGAVAWRYRDRVGARNEAETTGAAAETSDENRDGGDAASESEPAGADGTAGTDPREDLLSNEERVLQFVRDQGGRVKQQEIVEAFDWTEARTSQIVRDLRDDGSLDGFRLGRENVLKLPDEE